MVNDDLLLGPATNMVTMPRTIQYCASIGANAFMCRTTNTRGVGGKPLDKYDYHDGKPMLGQYGMVMGVHAPASINLASSRPNITELGERMFFNELERGGILGAKYVVVHAGRNASIGMENAVEQVIGVLTSGRVKYALQKYSIQVLFESMYGMQGEVGNTFHELALLMQAVPPSLAGYFGICLDTSHMWGAGYNLHDSPQVLQEFDAVCGLKYVKVVHVVGSQAPLGSRKDGHTNIGAGDWCPTGVDQIGSPALYVFVHHPLLAGRVFILETPIVDGIEGYDAHEAEIEYLRQRYC